MNKFTVFPCMKMDKGDADSYDGNAIVMVCEQDPSVVLMFPANAKEASLVNTALGENKSKSNEVSLSIYRTMLESWFEGCLHLSGVLLDIDFGEDKKEEFIDVKLVIINKDGNIDGFIDTCFTHAIILAAMDDTKIIVTDRLLDKLIPPEKQTKDSETSDLAKKMNYPEDKKLLELAQKIMSGKLKNDV